MEVGSKDLDVMECQITEMFATSLGQVRRKCLPEVLFGLWDCLRWYTTQMKSENEIALQARALRAIEALHSVKRPYTSSHNVSIFSI